MGQSSSVPGVIPGAKELTWKSGKKTEVIPNHLANVTNLDTLHTNSEFKDSLLMSFRSNYLISSILSDSCSNDSILLSGIQTYQALDEDFLAKIHAQSQAFREVNGAGISVKMSESLDVAEKDVVSKQLLKSSPFLKLFQKRLIVLQGLKDSIAHERILALEKRKPREYSSSPALSTEQFPQLLPFTALMETGLSFMRLFPMLLAVESLQGNSNMLLAPILSFQKDLSAIPSLALFKTWSPKPFPPVLALELDKASASASVGNAADVFDKGWSGNKSSCSWSVNVTSAEVISFITVQWASSGSPSTNGAPKCVTISSRPYDSTKPPPSKSLVGFEVFGVMFPDSEFKKQNTWTQIYPVRIQGPATIHLLMSKTAAANNASNGVKIFGFSVGVENTQMKCSNPLPMLHLIQQSLVPLGSIQAVAASSCRSMISLPYISGSLSLSLGLFDYLFFKKFESTAKQHCSDEFLRLLSAVYEEEKQVLLADTKKISDRIRDDVFFDEKCKSSDCILTENSMFASFTTSSAYVMTNVPMETGVWTWEISIIQDNNGDETSTLGIARRPLTSSTYDNNPNAWVVRCYNGELYHNGRMGSKALSLIHPKDVCRFVFDTEAQTLSLTVNDTDFGILFEDVPVGVYIYASFYSANKSVRLLSVRHRGLNADIHAPASRSLPPEFVKFAPTTEQLSEVGVSWSAMLLERIASLARSRANQILLAKTCGLEYPHSIEVSIDVFELLVNLLHSMAERQELLDNSNSTASHDVTHQEHDRIVLALLELLDVQFICLSLSKVDIAEVGFNYERKSVEIVQKSLGGEGPATETVLEDFVFASGKPTEFITKCHSVLFRLRNASKSAVRLSAATVLARGSILLFPNAVDKLKLSVATFDAVSAEACPDVNKASIALLASLLSQIHDISEIVHLFSQHKTGTVSLDLLFALINRLLAVVAIESFTPAQSTENNYSFLPAEVLKSAVILNKEAVIRSEAVKILQKFQQHAAYEYILCHHKYAEVYGTRVRILFEKYCEVVLSAVTSFFQMSLIALVGCSDSEHLTIEKCLEDSPLLKIVFPLLHAFCFCVDDSQTVRKLLPQAVHFFSVATALIKESRSCNIASSCFNSYISRQFPQGDTANGDDKHGGWRRVKDAAFETGESSYTVSEDGMLYTANHSSNTCAVVTMDSVLKYSKLAWEFELASDSVNDQCSVFGASRRHPTSRCYSSSPDLWMRRSYNGYMYANGTSTNSPMEKIQPNDIVRIEHDMKAGTISFSVNGGPLAVGFTHVNEPVFPSCGSYRTGVQIRLLKVETFGSSGAKTVENETIRSADQTKWFHPATGSDGVDEVKDAAVLTLPKVKPEKSKEKDKEQVKLNWLTARADQGATNGVCEWSFEIVDCGRTPFAVGVVLGGDPYPKEFLGGPCLNVPESKKTSKKGNTIAGGTTSATASLPDLMSRGSSIFTPMESSSASPVPTDFGTRTIPAPFSSTIFRPTQTPFTPVPMFTLSETSVPGLSEPVVLVDPVTGRSSGLSSPPDGLPVPPPRSLILSTISPGAATSESLSESTVLNETLASTTGSAVEASGDTKESEESSVVVGGTANSPIRASKANFNYQQAGIHALAWHSDGSLWIDGNKVATNYGKKFLPMEKLTSVAVRINRIEHTVSFYVNGECAGLAFGSSGSGASVVFDFPFPNSRLMGPSGTGIENVIYPAASISSGGQTIKICPTGLYGPVVLPFPLLIQKACSSVVGRLSAVLLTGPAVDKKEAQILPWLQSPLLIGGISRSNGASEGMYSEEEARKSFLHRISAIHNDKPAYIEGRLAAEWYEGYNPEPVALKKNLEAKGTYRFLQCELPFFAALMKHGGLVNEALSAISQVVAMNTSSPCDSNEDSDANFATMVTQLSLHTPSVDMLALWTRVKQLRVQLRKERQSFITKGPGSTTDSVSVTPSPAPPTIPAAPIHPVLQELIVADSSLFDIPNTAWVLQPPDTISRYNDGYYCVVLAVGYDYSSRRLLIRFNVHGNNSLGALQNPRSSRVKITRDHSVQFHCDDTFYSREGPREYAGLLAFPVTPDDLVVGYRAEFIYGASGYSSARIEIPSAALVGNNSTFAGVPDLRASAVASLLVPSSVDSLDTILAPVPSGVPSTGLVGVSGAVSAASTTTVPSTDASSVESASAPTSTPATVPSSPAPVVGYLQQLIDGDGGMFKSESTGWRLQPMGTISRYNASYFCHVFAVGYDFESGYILVRFRVCCDNSLGELQSPLDSQLIVDDDGEAGQDCDADTSYFAREDPTSEILGTIRFEADYDALTSELPEGRLFFRYGADGYSRAPITLPDRDATGNNTTFAASLTAQALAAELSATQAKEEEEEAKAAPKSFEEYCKVIEDRSRFLLRFKPSNDVLDADSEDSVRSKMVLSKMLESSGGVGGGSPRQGRFRSDDGDNRWKQVIGILRAHSKLKKQHSSTDSLRMSSTGDILSHEGSETTEMPGFQRSYSQRSADEVSVEEVFRDSSVNMDEDDSFKMSPAQASMQAGALFICGDTLNVSIELLDAMLERREDRARCRVVAFQSLNQLISLPSAIDDFFSVEETLLFVRSAMQSNANIKSAAGNNVASIHGLLGKNRIHYLTNLEGCSLDVSQLVQDSFLEFFSRVTQLLTRYVEHWELSSRSIQKQNQISISPRSVIDHQGYLCLNGVRMMMSLWCIHFSTRDHRFLFHCGLLPALYRLISLSTYEAAAQTWLYTANSLVDFVKAHSASSTMGGPWKAWSDGFVEEGLKSGQLSCRSVLMQLCMMPDTLLSKELKSKKGLGSFRSLIGKCGVTDTSLLFHKISSVLRSNREKAEQAKEKEISALEAIKATKVEKLNEIAASCGKFDSGYCGSGITLSSNNIHAAVSPGLADHEPVCVMATVHYEVAGGLMETGNYFEVEILVVGRGDIGVGFCNRNILPLRGRMPGWDPAGSYAYHGDDGKKFGPSATPGDWALWANGDIIGCGIDPVRRAIFYTRNGVLLGDAFTNVTETNLWPVVGFANQNRTPEKVAINFGTKPFAYTGPDVILMPRAVAERTATSSQLEEIRELTAKVSRLGSATSSEGDTTHEEVVAELTSDEYSSQLKSLTDEFNSANAYLLELSQLRNLASAILVFLMIVTRLSEDNSSSGLGELGIGIRPTHPDVSSDGKTLGPMPASGNAIVASPPSKLSAGVSTFGTPKIMTSADGRSLQEAIHSALVQEVIVGSEYLVLIRKAGNRAGDEYSRCGSGTMRLPPPTTFGRTIALLHSNKLDVDSASNTSSASFPTTDGNDVVVEAFEVESTIFEHLNTLHSLIYSSTLLVEELSSSTVLRTLLNLLLVGSPRVIQVVYKILYCCLPLVSPEEAEKAVSSSWKERLEGRVEADASTGNRRKRKMPTSILKLLFAEVQQTISRPVVTDAPIGTHAQHVSFGLGDEMMLTADHSVHLLQKLFDNASWTEVVSCTLTDSFRDALAVMSVVNSVEGNTSEVALTMEQIQTLEAACASLAIFNGFSSLRPGARVRSLDGPSAGAEGYLVSINEIEQTAKVVFIDKPAIESLDKVEKVGIASIQVISESVKVDLSRLSQPVLPQLVMLIKSSLQFARKLHSSIAVAPQETPLTESESVVLKMAAHCTTALSSLVESNADQLMDCLINEDLIADIVNLSLLPSGLPSFADLDSISRVWLFTQARVIESSLLYGYPAAAANSTAAAGVTDIVGEEQERSSISTKFVESKVDSTRTEMSLDSNLLSRHDVSTSLSIELSLPREVCTRRLEYFMYNVDAARASLLFDNGTTDEFEDSLEAAEVPATVKAVTVESKTVEGHLLNNIENGEGKEEAISFLENSDKLSRFTLTNASNTTIPPGGKPSDAVTTLNAAPLDYVAESDMEGMSNIVGGRIGVCVIPDLATEEMLVGMHDKHLGVTLFEVLSIGNCKKLSHFYNTTPRNLQHLQDRLGFAVSVLRVREIAAKMLMDGSFNLENDASKLSDWLLLMKLVVASSGSSVSSGKHAIDAAKLSSMCSSLLQRAAASKSGVLKSEVIRISSGSASIPSTAQVSTIDSIATATSATSGDTGTQPSSRVISSTTVVAAPSPPTGSSELQAKIAKLMAKDLEEEVSALAESRKLRLAFTADKSVDRAFSSSELALTRTRSASLSNVVKEKKIEPMYFASTHPFVAPSVTTGEITLPPTWKGTSVTFHPSCATPSATKAKLAFYASQQDLDKDKPISSCCGSSDGFVPLSFPSGTKSFWYKFTSSEHGNRPVLALRSSHGQMHGHVLSGSPIVPKIVSPSRSSDGPVGLGDDDTLANLFGMGDDAGTSADVQPSSTTVAEASPLRELVEPDICCAFADMNGLGAGVWYFEVTVLKNDCASNIRSVLTGDSEADFSQNEETILTRIRSQLDKNRIGVVSGTACSSVGAVAGSVALSANGLIHYCSAGSDSVETILPQEASSSWEPNDVIGVALFLEPSNLNVLKARFSKNGEWGATVTAIQQQSSSGRSGRPAFEISGPLQIEINFGDTAFKHLPVINSVCQFFDTSSPNPAVMEVLTGQARVETKESGSTDVIEESGSRSAATDLPAINEATENATSNCAIADPASGCVTVLPLIDRPLTEAETAISWGYCFKVQELNDFGVSAARTYDLIWSKESDEKSSDKPDKDKEPPCTIWRPKSTGDYLSVGDIVVHSKLPPQGALLVYKRHCLPAKSFKKVFSTDGKLYVWRPVPPTGYVALGDWATTSSSPPSVDICMCVPQWVVRSCAVGKKMYASRKAVSVGGKDKNCTASIWATLSGLGTFIGNPLDTLHGTLGKTETEVELLSSGYSLKEDHSIISIMAGEWAGEDVVSTHGSLSWCNSMFRNVLDSPITRPYVVTTSMFSNLVNYLKSNVAPNPFKAVAMLVQFIRSAYSSSHPIVPLPISQLDGLCKSVLAKAVSKKEKGGMLSDQLFSLVDLVVEVIIVQFSDGSDGDTAATVAPSSKSVANITNTNTSPVDVGTTVSGDANVEPSKPARSLLREPSEQIQEQDDDAAPSLEVPVVLPALVEAEASTVAVSNGNAYSETATSANWWENRPALVESHVIEAARSLGLKKIETVFGKDPPLRKLKYAIKFFHALESLRQLHSKRDMKDVKDRSKRIVLPKRMVCKLWYDHASTCVVDESEHPYKPLLEAQDSYHRRIFMPGADSLVVIFDKRCSLGVGVCLEFRHADGTFKFTHASSSSSWSTITIPGESVDIYFTRIESKSEKVGLSASKTDKDAAVSSTEVPTSVGPQAGAALPSEEGTAVIGGIPVDSSSIEPFVELPSTATQTVDIAASEVAVVADSDSRTAGGIISSSSSSSASADGIPTADTVAPSTALSSGASSSSSSSAENDSSPTSLTTVDSTAANRGVNEWGWSFIVNATGAVYESALVGINASINPAWLNSELASRDQDEVIVSSNATEKATPLVQGSKVEVNISGKWRRGIVADVKSDGTFDISYDGDDDLDLQLLDVSLDRIRLFTESNSRDGSAPGETAKVVPVLNVSTASRDTTELFAPSAQVPPTFSASESMDSARSADSTNCGPVILVDRDDSGFDGSAERPVSRAQHRGESASAGNNNSNSSVNNTNATGDQSSSSGTIAAPASSSSTAASVVDEADITAINELFAEVKGELEDSNDDLVLPLVARRGVEVRSGNLRVPYATELDITVVPKIVQEPAVPVIQVLKLSFAAVGESQFEDVFIRIKSEDKQCSCTLPAEAVRYSLHLMSQSRLKAILQAKRTLGASVAAEEDGTTVIVCEGVDGNEGYGDVSSATAADVPASTASPGTMAAVEAAAAFADEDDGQWACPLCTMLNTADDMACTMCMTPRAAGGDGSEGGAAAPGGETGWWCTVCTFINPLSVTSCGMCASRRMDGGADAAAADGSAGGGIASGSGGSGSAATGSGVAGARGSTSETTGDEDEVMEYDEGVEVGSDDDDDDARDAMEDDEDGGGRVGEDNDLIREARAVAAAIASGGDSDMLGGSSIHGASGDGGTSSSSSGRDGLRRMFGMLGDESTALASVLTRMAEGRALRDSDSLSGRLMRMREAMRATGITGATTTSGSAGELSSGSAADESKERDSVAAGGGDNNKKSVRFANNGKIAVTYGPLKDSVLLGKVKKLTVTAGEEDMIVIYARGKLSTLSKFETRLEGLLSIGKGVVTPHDIFVAMMDWTPDMDNNLLEFVNHEQQQLSSSSSSSSSSKHIGHTILLPKTQLAYAYSNLSGVNMLEIQNRTMLIESMNSALEEILPIINLGNQDARSFGATIRRYSKYVFMSLKTPLLDKAIKQSAATGAGLPAQLVLDNFKAIESRERGDKDPATSNCCFVQAFKQLQAKDSNVFRHTFSDNRVFQINFTGESGIDAGGVFREGMTRIVEDVFSEHFNLLLLCPNGQHTVHINTDKFVPNPQHTGPLAMQMFEFLGRLMGASLRAKLSLPFEFPSIVWKKLIGEELVIEDLSSFDVLTYKLIDAIRHCEHDGIVDQASFRAKYNDQLRFVYNGSDGVERELGKGHRGRVVTFDTRHEYCDLLLQARLSEFDKQVAAISRGLLDVVPSRVLQLFSASQVEILIAGNPNFDMELWKRQTDATSISPRTLALFWQVMESLTPQEQSGFVRFAWGRSRLPAAKEFTTRMKLTAGSSSLPIAHTCFFSVEMPDYKTVEEMRHGLMTVINFGCGGILNG